MKGQFMTDTTEAASVRACQCIWEGPTSDPRLIRPCVGHLIWMQDERQKAVEAEREACAQVPLNLAMAGEIDPATAELVQDKIRNRT